MAKSAEVVDKGEIVKATQEQGMPVLGTIRQIISSKSRKKQGQWAAVSTAVAALTMQGEAKQWFDSGWVVAADVASSRVGTEEEKLASCKA